MAAAFTNRAARVPTAFVDPHSQAAGMATHVKIQNSMCSTKAVRLVSAARSRPPQWQQGEGCNRCQKIGFG